MVTDLGTLGGPNSYVGDLNDRGDVTVGGADTTMKDPLGEDVCGFGTGLTCRSFVWHDGMKWLIPTLGGNNGDVATITNSGEILAAFGETSFHDPTCIAPQVLQVEAYLLNKGRIQVLPPLPGDSDTVAFNLNDDGQAVGASGICGSLSPSSLLHAVMWEDGKPVYLGSLGGVMGNVAFFNNSHGQVIGASDLPGDVTSHAFLWQKGVMTDLGTLVGDFSSVGSSINDNGQIVGQSCDVSFNCRAVIWRDGVMTDLNALTAGGSLYLINANSINARGEIVGQAFDSATGDTPAFLAIPVNGYGAHRSSKLLLPKSVREGLERRRGVDRFRP